MASAWLKFSFACLIFAKCVMSGAGAAALNKVSSLLLLQFVLKFTDEYVLAVT